MFKRRAKLGDLSERFEICACKRTKYARLSFARQRIKPHPAQFPISSVFSNLLRACSRCGDAIGAKMFLDEMVSLDIIPSAKTYHYLFQSQLRANDVRDARLSLVNIFLCQSITIVRYLLQFCFHFTCMHVHVGQQVDLDGALQTLQNLCAQGRLILRTWQKVIFVYVSLIS